MRREYFVAAAAVALAVQLLLALPLGSSGADTALQGNLKVNVNPAVPSTIFVDGVWMDGGGVKAVPMDVGSHTVSFSDVPGFGTPNPVNIIVTAGGTTTVVGSFARLGALRVVSEPAVKSTISVDGVPIDDYGVGIWIAPGTHKVSFGPVAGYDAPVNQTVKLRAGDQVVVTGKFLENANATGDSKMGMLRVATSPAVPTTITVDGVPRDTFGLAWLKIEPGTHIVSFSDVPGFATPADQTVDVAGPGQVAEICVEFVREGGLMVETAPPSSEVVYVDGVARDCWGLWVTLPAGTYTVSFGATPGHEAPPTQSVQVIPGQITLVMAQ